MPQKTDYHDYDIPVPYDISAEDTNVWGDILNGAFRHLDEDTILRGTGATRPDAEREGRLFLDTGDVRLQYDTGDSWEYLGAQAQFYDSGAFTITGPAEIDFDGDISATKTGANRLRIDVDDSFVRNTGDEMVGALGIGTSPSAPFHIDGRGLTDASGDADFRVDARRPNFAMLSPPENGDVGFALEVNESGRTKFQKRDGADGFLGDWLVFNHTTDDLTIGEDFDGVVQFSGGDLRDADGNTIYDQSANRIPRERIEQGAGTGLDADTLDGVELAAIDWHNTALDQSEVNVSHLGKADANLGMGDYDVVGVQSLQVNNHEQADFTGSGGQIYFNENYYGDYAAFTGSNGGGLAVYSEDGWGALLDTNNMQWVAAVFNALETKGDITAASGELIWDDANKHIPESRLQHNDITITAGTGIASAGTTTLGNSVTIDVDDSRYVQTAGDAMSGPLAIGGISTSESNEQAASTHAGSGALGVPWVYASAIEADAERGGSSTLIELGSNAAQTNADEIALITQGEKNLLVDAGKDVQVTNQLFEGGDRVATRPWTNATFYDTTEADNRFVNASGDVMSGPLTLGGDLTASGGETLWDESASHIPQSRLSNDSVTVVAGNALTGGGAVALGGSVTVNVDESQVTHGNLEGLTGTDHHTQYMHTDARRGFTNPVDGVDPSAQTHLATKEYVDSTAQGLEYKESVIDHTGSPPASPSAGDRYLIGSTPSGDWSGHPGELTEYDGAAWTFNVPNEGWSVFIEDINTLKTFNGNGWVTFGSTIQHDALQGLSDDDHIQYYHRDGRRPLTGAMNVDGHALNNVGSIEMDGDINGIGVDMSLTEVSMIRGPKNGATDLTLQTNGTGSHTITLRDGANGQDRLVVSEGGDTAIRNGPLNLTGEAVTGLNYLKFTTGNALFDQNSANSFVWKNSDGTTTLELTHGGDLEVPTGQFHVSGEALLDSGWTAGHQSVSVQTYGGGDGKLQFYDKAGGQPLLRIHEGGKINFQNSFVTFDDFLELQPTSEPAAPASGKRLYVDSTDGGLKVKDTSGAVVTIAE